MTRQTKVHVQLFRGTDADLYREGYLAGNMPDESPYGFHLAREHGFELTFSKTSHGIADRLLKSALWRLCGFDLMHAYANRREIRNADVIWVMTEGEAFAIALLFYIGVLPKRPIVCNVIWLLNEWDRVGRLRRRLYTRLLRIIDIVTVHSEECRKRAQQIFPLLPVKLVFFGINLKMFSISSPEPPALTRPIRVLSAGNDRTRDWQTLLTAFGNCDDFEVTIVCSWIKDEDIVPFSNVKLVKSPSMAEFLSCYKSTDIVAVPMFKNLYSGITVALEAAALGKPVLSSRTGGVPTYFDEDEVLFVAPEDPVALRETLLRATPDMLKRNAKLAQQRLITQRYSTDGVIDRYADMTAQLSDHTGQ